MAFECINNLYDVSTIEQCYDDRIKGPVPGIKDEKNEWNLKGHPERLIIIGKNDLALFAQLFEGSENWRQAILPNLHSRTILAVLTRLAYQEKTLNDLKENVYTTQMWNETNSQTDNTIMQNVRFPEKTIEAIYSGAHIGVANPLCQTTRSNYRVNSDYDRVDLTNIPDDYLIRVKYGPKCEIEKFVSGIPTTPWGEKFTEGYSLVNREMVGCTSERTLTSAISFPGMTFVNTVFGVKLKDQMQMVCLAGCEASLPFDFLVKIIGKGHVNYRTNMLFPLLPPADNASIVLRSLLLNCLNVYYKDLWSSSWNTSYKNDFWSKPDPRLKPERFTSLTPEWTWDTPLRTDYERRQALVEIDVLTAMALGMTLDQLKTIYRIQFPVLQSYEADTWYDRNGRITFTNNRSLTGVGYARHEWDNIKTAPSGTFTRTISDDTLPGGPVERTIEYVAPFDRCDREQDYETAWKFFEGKYKR
jgi:hypothetical protein